MRPEYWADSLTVKHDISTEPRSVFPVYDSVRLQQSLWKKYNRTCNPVM